MIYTLIALVLGFCSPIQTAANSRMRQLVSSAALSTLISFAVSTIVLIIVALIASIPLMDRIGDMPLLLDHYADIFSKENTMEKVYMLTMQRKMI